MSEKRTQSDDRRSDDRRVSAVDINEDRRDNNDRRKDDRRFMKDRRS